MPVSGRWRSRPSSHLDLKQIGALMPGTPFPSSSPLSIEPISMRVPDACRFTGISRSTLYLLIARGEVEVVKMGAATLVLTESLRNLIERQRGSRMNRTAVPIEAKPFTCVDAKPGDDCRRHRTRSRLKRPSSTPLFDER